MNRFRVLLCLAPSLLPLAPAQATDECRNIIMTYAFTSRAQFQCHFHDYDRSMIAAASSCFRQYSKENVDMLLKRGVDIFDEHEINEGHAAFCEKVLQQFPMVLRR